MKRLFRILCVLLIVNCQLSIINCSAITLNGVEFTVDTLRQFSPGPGAMYYQLRMFRADNHANRLDCWLMTVDTRNPYVSVRQVLGGGKIVGTERPSAMAKRCTNDTTIFYGGTNGDFFVTVGDVGRPTGLTVVDSEFAYVPGSSTRYLGAVNEEMQGVLAAAMNFSATCYLPSAGSVKIHHVNYNRNDNQLVLYNRHNGATTGTNQYGTELLIEPLPGEAWHTTGSIRCVVRSKETSVGAMAIPAGQAVLSGHGSKDTILRAINVDDTLRLEFQLKMDNVPMTISQCIGADNYCFIVENGQPCTSGYWNELHPRTGFGASQDGKTLQFLVVDGRGISAGCTTRVLGEIMAYYGSYNAVNWDGGGSSCLYIRHWGEVNNGSDGTERAVGNAMFAVANVPAADNVVTAIAPTIPHFDVPRYGVVAPQFMGYNQYGVLVDTCVAGVVLSADPSVGEVLGEGRFLASGENGGILHASFGEATCDMAIRLSSSAPVAIRLDTVVCDASKPYTVEVTSQIGVQTINLLAAALTWRSFDESIATVDTLGNVLGVSNGVTSVIGTLGSFSDTLIVRVEIPESNPYAFSNYLESDLWTLTASSDFNPELLADTTGNSQFSIFNSQLKFTFKKLRGPFIKLAVDTVFYSRPSLIRFGFYTPADISKVVVGVRANNERVTSKETFTSGFAANQPSYVDIDVASSFGTDPAIYPLHLEYINITLATTTAAGEQVIHLSPITLYYDGLLPSDDISTADPSCIVHCASCTKFIKDGQVFILRNGQLYDALGREVK